jgi:hypothetical protein
MGVGGTPSVMRKEEANNDDVSYVDDVELGDCWYSTDRVADRGNREAAEKIRLRYE